MNGSGANLNAMVTQRGEGGEIPHEPAVIQVNFGLKPRHIWALITALPATMAALGGIGLFYIPAKSEDLKALEKTVQEIKVNLEVTATATKGLMEAVDRLNKTITSTAKKAAPLKGKL